MSDKKLFDECLRGHGIPPKDAKRLGLRLSGARATGALAPNYVEAASIVFTYRSLEGKTVRNFNRIRYLGDIPTKGWKTEKPRRYSQPIGSKAFPYFPVLSRATWTDVAKTTALPIIITEGEFKAIAGKAVYPTIALPGVWSFFEPGTKKLMADLGKIDWRDRKVYIAFDADIVKKPPVAAAMNKLAVLLSGAGAQVFVTNVPEIEQTGASTGIDDILLHEGKEALAEIIEASTPLPMIEDLMWLNERAAWVGPLSRYAVRDADGSYYLQNPTAFATEFASKKITMTNSAGNETTLPLTKVWNEWPLRAAVRGFTFEPFAERITPDNYINNWRPYEIKASSERGSILPFIKLLDLMFHRDETKTYRDWFINWLAYAYQGNRNGTAAYLWSPTHGTGKSLLASIVARLFSPNAREVDDDALDTRFTGSWVSRASMVIADELVPRDRSSVGKVTERMRSLITASTIRVENKGVDSYEIRPKFSMMLMSNAPNAINFAATERRYGIIEVSNQKMTTEEAQPYANFRDDEMRMGHLARYLLDRDLSKYDPYRAPDTDSRETAIDLAAGDLDAFVNALRRYPTQTLRRIGVPADDANRDLWTTTQLSEFYNNSSAYQSRNPVGYGLMSRALTNAGFNRLPRAENVDPECKHDGIYYVIRNDERWLRATKKQIVKYLRDIFWDTIHDPDANEPTKTKTRKKKSNGKIIPIDRERKF